MGRTIVFDDKVQDILNSIIKRKQLETGLIIGQVTEQKDFVLHLCPTPVKIEGSETTDTSENTSDSSKSRTSTTQTKKSNCFDLDSVDDKWICQHAKQVTRMLPGGIDILGLYISSPADTFVNLQSRFRQILFAVYKVLAKDVNISLARDWPERILLHICPISQKYVCRTFDVSDLRSIATPADWKRHQGTFRWNQLKTNVSLDLKIPVPKEKTTHSLKKQIENGLKPTYVSIMEALPAINGIVKQPEELLDSSFENRKGKHKSKEQGGHIYDVDLFLPLGTRNNNSESKHPEVSECSSVMSIQGTICCCAFIHGKASVQESIQALKQDVIRSIMSRYEIQCEDLLLIDEEQQDPVLVHELPKRVFAPLHSRNITVSDYLFHGDMARDSLDAFHELLNLDLLESDIDMTGELFPSTHSLIHSDVLEDRLSEAGDPKTTSRSLIIPVASAAVAAIAAGLSYFFLLQDS